MNNPNGGVDGLPPVYNVNTTETDAMRKIIENINKKQKTTES